MPIFEFECRICSYKFEDLVSSGQTDIACPKCGSIETRKLLSVFAATAGSSSSATPCGQPGCGSGFS